MPTSAPFAAVLGVAALMFFALTVSYWVIRIAVRDGIRDATARSDAEPARSELPMRPERSSDNRRD